jgi:HTH-type transcriptional regulator / antitoxin HipB
MFLPTDLKMRMPYMIRFRDHLEAKLKNPEFAKGFDKEIHAARLALAIAEARESQKLTQSDLAAKAHITQQQLSKVENSKACKVETLLKICDALGMDLLLSPRKPKNADSGKAATSGISVVASKRRAGKVMPSKRKGAAKRATFA